MSFKSVTWSQTFDVKALGGCLCWSVSTFWAPVAVNVISKCGVISVKDARAHASQDNAAFEDAVDWIPWANDDDLVQ
jgi:hypothetical protein